MFHETGEMLQQNTIYRTEVIKCKIEYDNISDGDDSTNQDNQALCVFELKPSINDRISSQKISKINFVE